MREENSSIVNVFEADIKKAEIHLRLAPWWQFFERSFWKQRIKSLEAFRDRIKRNEEVARIYREEREL